jgi:hypothetical protein
LIHERVAAGSNDFSTGDGAIALDLDFYRADERFILLENRGWLLPLTKKSIVDKFVIPSELAGSSTRPAFACAAGSRTPSTCGCAGFG